MIETKYVDNFKEFYENRKEFIHARYAEAKPLCNSDRDLNLDIDAYQNLINSNAVTVLEVFEDQEFIGYCSITISPALLSNGRVDAKVDHLALDEQARNRGCASFVLEEIENLLKDQGVDELGIVLPSTEMHDGFAKAKGYKKTVTIHTKNLEAV